jgi:hypothetical protein
MKNKVENGEVFIIPAKVTDAEAVKLAKKEWVRRYVTSDGTLKKNRFAPIYARRGDAEGERLVFLYGGDTLTLFKATEHKESITTKVVVS